MKLSSRYLDKIEKSDIDRKEKLSKNIVTEKSYFRWFPLAISSIVVLTFLVTVRGYQKLSYFTSHKPYIYVQKSDGEVAVAQPTNDLDRDTKVIQSFASDWIKLAFTWQLDDSDGSVTQDNIAYPSPLHIAALAIIPEYRKFYLPAVNQRYSQQFKFEDYISGKSQSYISIFDEPIVSKVEPGVWDVTVIAYRTHAQNKSIIDEEKFNHVFRIRAIDPGDAPNKIEQKISEQDTLLYQLMKTMQSKGLQIIKITVL